MGKTISCLYRMFLSASSVFSTESTSYRAHFRIKQLMQSSAAFELEKRHGFHSKSVPPVGAQDRGCYRQNCHQSQFKPAAQNPAIISSALQQTMINIFIVFLPLSHFSMCERSAFIACKTKLTDCHPTFFYHPLKWMVNVQLLSILNRIP